MKYLFFSATLLTACNNNSIPTKKTFSDSSNNNDTNMIQTLKQNKYENSNNYQLVPIMYDALNKSGYKFPSHSDFRNMVLNLFSVDIDTAKYDDISLPQIDGDYVVIRDKEFISTISGEEDLNQVKTDLIQPRIIGNKGIFINFNKLIFNKSLEAQAYFFINNQIVIRDIVSATGFYLDTAMLKIAINFIDLKNSASIGDIIFDKYKPIRKRLRTDILKFISEYRNEVLNNIVLHFPKDFSPYDLTLFTKDEVNNIIANVLELKIQTGEDGMAEYYFGRHPEYLDILKSNNYYGLPLLKKYATTEYIINPDDRKG